MIFYNTTDNSIFLEIDSKKYKLKPNESIDVACSTEVDVVFRHDYGSKAMSEKEIARDDTDASLVSLVTSSYREPYFELVLDCSYKIKGTQDSSIYIKKEKIRPVYSCSYDRLYPDVKDGLVKELSYTFPERKQFENHYMNAISRGNKMIINILLGVLVLFGLLLLILCFLAKIIFGIIALFLLVFSLVVIWAGANLIVKLVIKADWMAVVSNFESNKIIKYFNKNKGEKNA